MRTSVAPERITAIVACIAAEIKVHIGKIAPGSEDPGASS